MWDWFFDISGSVSRSRDYVCHPIPPSEYVAWQAITGNVVHLSEYAILRAMDAAYRSVMTDELQALKVREIEAARTPPKGGKR